MITGGEGKYLGNEGDEDGGCRCPCCDDSLDNVQGVRITGLKNKNRKRERVPGRKGEERNGEVPNRQ